MNRELIAGDEVAILPSPSSLAHHVLEIVSIMRIGEVFLQLADGRMFATIGGKCLEAKTICYAVPATEDHRKALRKKKEKNGEGQQIKVESEVCQESVGG